MSVAAPRASDSAAATATKAEERRAIGVASGAHALHDGYTDLIYVMLPIWQAEFGLGYAALGLLRTCYAGTMAALQIPSGLLSERLGVPLVLAAGTALAGLAYLLAGASVGFVTLVIALLVGGAGASVQHPLASTLVARAFAGPRSMKALGAYNFAGDIGKMTLPALSVDHAGRAAVAADARDLGWDRFCRRCGDHCSDATFSRSGCGTGDGDERSAR